MTATIHDTLLDLFQQVIEDPDDIPVVPIDAWQEGSEERRLLTGFREMLEHMQQNRRKAEEELTEQVEAEQQLREKEEQYRAIFEASTDALIICDQQGVVVEVNPAACSMSGEEYGEWIGQNISYPKPFGTQSSLNQSPLPARGQFLNVPGTIRHKDGSVIPVEARSIHFTYKGQPHILAIARDISERVQAEQQLREKEEEYRSIFEASIDGLIIIDQENRVVEANPAACQIHGYTREELLGRSASSEVVNVRDIIQTGGTFHTREKGIRKDGVTFYSEVRGTPFTYKGKHHMLGIVRDITEQVEAEEQLREREAEYRSVFEATSDGLFITDFDDGHLVEVNPAAYKMHGYGYQEFIALHPTAFIHPDSHPLFIEYLQTVKAGGQFHAQAMDVRKDGTIFPVEVYGTTFIYRGKPHVLGIVRDISERVEAEKQLREREEQYRSVFEATSDGLIIRDMDGFVVEANPAACKMHGYAYEEFIGLHRTDIIDPSDHAMVAEYMKAIRAGHSFLGQAVDLRKDGTPFPVEVRGTTFTYQGKPHTLSVLRDITERVEAEKQLREREEQYRSVFEATDDGLTITDLDGYFIEVNPAYCRMLGYTREELIGLHYSQTTFPEYYPVLDESARAIEAGGQYQTQGLARRKDGSPLPVEAHATPFIYKGKPHVLGVVRDITERVEAEKQLREREEQYRSIFETTNDALFIMDLEDGHIVEANPAACDIYRYSYEEFIGLSISAVIHPDQLPFFREQGLPSIRATGKRHIQGVNLRKDGSQFPIDLHQTVFTYQDKPHILSVMRDITEQVQAQQLLEQRVEERTRELFTLLEVSRNVALTIDLKTLLDLILDQLKVVVDYAGSAITILEGEDLVLVGTRGPESEEHLVQHRFSLKSIWPVWEALCRGELVVIDNILDDTPAARAYRETVGDLLETTLGYVRSWICVPLKLKDQVIGMLSASHSHPDFYTPHHAELALAIANQAAVAIENARLYAQAQDLAALEERQKLARELHDSVSQALYGISLGAHAARTALAREPDQVSEPLDYVLSLAEAALAEMRALIFELRPESLETEGLVSALSKQAAATQARHELAVATELCEEPDLSLHVKQELYRVAQEAMHNIVKHAHASQVTLRLAQTDNEVVLEVRDNGAGFDTSASFPGHLGLYSMRERVANIGGAFQIESGQGKGTLISVCIPGHV